MEYQLKSRQICLFFIAFLPIIKFFMLPSVVAERAAEDMLISTLINIFADFITVAVLIFACKRAKTDFYGLLKERFGTGVANAVYILYAVYFLLKGFLPICEQKDYISLSLYITQPTVVYFLPFFIVAFYLSLKHLRVLGRLADIFWIVTLSGFILLFSLSVSNADAEAFLPIGARGAEAIFKGSYSSLTWYGDGIYLLFFMGNFAYNKKDFLKIGAGYIISSIMTLAFMFVFFGVFKSVAFRQKFALTEISKYSTVINNIGRFDYIGIFLILISSFISFALPLYFANYCMQKVIKLKQKWIIPLIMTSLTLFAVIFLREYLSSLEDIFINRTGPVFILTGNVIPLFVPLLQIKRRSYETDKG